jgi:hypothetical protein
MGDEDTKQVRLCDLRTNSCRWPLGGIWEHVEFFCGDPTVPGGSWCKEHRERVFSRAMVRSRKAPTDWGRADGPSPMR